MAVRWLIIYRQSINGNDAVFAPCTRWPPGGVIAQRGPADCSSIKAEHISIYKQAASLTLQLHTAWAHNCAAEICAAFREIALWNSASPSFLQNQIYNGGRNDVGCRESERRSEFRRGCLLSSVQGGFFFYFVISVSHTVCFLPSVCEQMPLRTHPFNALSDKWHSLNTHAGKHTHLYICDLQSAILHQGRSGFISLKYLAVLLPRNPDWGPSDYTAVQLRRRTLRYRLIGRALANYRRDATWRTYQFEERGNRICYYGAEQWREQYFWKLQKIRLESFQLLKEQRV